MPHRDPIITKGLVFADRAKRAETNLIAAYWRLGEWLRDELPKTDISMPEFARAAGYSYQSVSKYKQIAVHYGTLDNIPADYTAQMAYNFRKTYAAGGEMPTPTAPGYKAIGVQAVIKWGDTSTSWMHSASKALDSVDSISTVELAMIEENAGIWRAEVTELLRKARRLVPMELAA